MSKQKLVKFCLVKVEGLQGVQIKVQWYLKTFLKNLKNYALFKKIIKFMLRIQFYALAFFQEHQIFKSAQCHCKCKYFIYVIYTIYLICDCSSYTRRPQAPVVYLVYCKDNLCLFFLVQFKSILTRHIGRIVLLMRYISENT